VEVAAGFSGKGSTLSVVVLKHELVSLVRTKTTVVPVSSRIGFGTGGHHTNTRGKYNQAARGADNGNKHIKAMGYILVQ